MNQSWRALRAILVFGSTLSLGICAGSTGGNAQNPAVVVKTVGKPEIAIPWQNYNCPAPGGNVADTPTRAYRDGSGMIHMFGVNRQGMAFVGSSFHTLKQNCTPVYRSHENPDPSRFQYQEWVQPYAIQGNRIFALIHNEFHGLHNPDIRGACSNNRNSRGKQVACWYVSLQRGESTDGGYTFSSPEPPNNFLFGIPYRFEPDMIRAGFGSRTMIKSPLDGNYYAFIGGNPYKEAKARGSCLARSSDLRDWRFWTGRDFTGVFVNPYAVADLVPERHVCPQVFVNDIMSVVYDERHKVFVALTRKTFDGDMTFQYATSLDLVRWSEPSNLFSASEAGGLRIQYPSFIDPESAAPNFDITQGKLFLYYINWAETKRDGTIDIKKRDVMRVPVVFEPARN